MKEIVLTKGKVALVDDADFDWLNQWKWYAYDNSGRGWYAIGYFKISKHCYEKARMHRLILGVTDDKSLIDHIDGNGLNNQRINLRLCNSSENQGNRNGKSNGSSKYKGVCRIEGKNGYVSWRSELYLNGIKVFQKNFSSEDAAAIAYNQAAIKHYGSFAKLNIITT